MREEGYYSEERWRNWMKRIEEEEVDSEEEEGAVIFFNLQDDITIGCAKALMDYEDAEIGKDELMQELHEIREIVMEEKEFQDEEKTMLLDGVQTSLLAVFASCEVYANQDGEHEHDHGINEVLKEAVKAEKNEEIDRALDLVAHAGAHIIDGEEFNAEEIQSEIEYGFVAEWINGLDSLHDAVKGPEVIEEDD